MPVTAQEAWAPNESIIPSGHADVRGSLPLLKDFSQSVKFVDAPEHFPQPQPQPAPSVRTETLPAGESASLVAVVRDPKADDTQRNEAIVALRRARYAGLADDLIRVLDNPEEEERFRSFAMQHLGEVARQAGVGASTARDLRDGGFGEGGGGSRPMVAPTTDRGLETAPTRVLDALRSGLDDRHVAVRREALLALARLGDPGAADTAVQWLTRGAANGSDVRDIAIRCVQGLDLREQIPAIRNLSADANNVVRIAALDALSKWGDEASRPAFESAAASNVPRLQRAGQMALARLDRLKQK